MCHFPVCLSCHALFDMVACELAIRGYVVGISALTVVGLGVLGHLPEHRTPDLHCHLMKFYFHDPVDRMAITPLDGVDSGVRNHLQGLAGLLAHVLHT